ncbi:MAG: dihydrolipoyl dehydrogenase [Candidatus Nanohaloarchaeota archaeon QJJ-5]|nr:dihydrolipoyl dehydrogenase [Candidatus Nanohaloarchaeota archaeon QJJ-5]
MTEDYDLLVIGAGSGLDVASAYHSRGKRVALVEPGPLGGTCLNRGCIPSKMLIHRADIVETIKDADRFHIDASVEDISFKDIIDEVNETVGEDAASIEQAVRESDDYDLYKAKAEFVDEKTVEVDGTRITADQVLISAGTRPLIPPVDGLEDVEYMTSKEALEREQAPGHMIIIGGGYIATELAHFYKAMGTDITIIEMSDVLVGNEDREISEKFTEIAREQFDVHTEMKATAVDQDGDTFSVTALDTEETEHTFDGDALLVAAGRVPNTDSLNVEAAGVETDDRGFIETDEKLQTSADGVYALGDIAGNYMFKHSANLEAQYAMWNMLLDRGEAVDYTAMPHAIFSRPEVAGVGMTEQQLEENGRDYRVARYDYSDTGKGMALKEEDGFVKVLADPETDEILGCHIMGPHAAKLIHEVLVAMRHGDGTVEEIADTIHIHPALNEVVQRAFNQL